MNLIQLLNYLRPLLKQTEANIVQNKYKIEKLLRDYDSQAEDYAKFVLFSESNYTKSFVEKFNSIYNVIIMCWHPKQESLFHGHEGSKCFVKVLQGSLIEQQVKYPKESCLLETISKRELKINELSYIDDNIGIHKMSNVSSKEPAITLHIYLPAYENCRLFYLQDNYNQIDMDKILTSEVSFWNSR